MSVNKIKPGDTWVDRKGREWTIANVCKITGQCISTEGLRWDNGGLWNAAETADGFDHDLDLIEPKKQTSRIANLTVVDILLKALNEIDDYFEYANESKRDRVRVHSILDKMNNKLKQLNQK